MAKPTKSKAVEKEVIIRRMSGDSKSKIARDIGIHRETVAAILTRTQAEECIVAARNRLIGMADKATDRVEKSIRMRKREGLDASLAVLRGVGVIQQHSKQEVKLTDGIESMSDDELIAIIEGRVPGASTGNPRAKPS